MPVVLDSTVLIDCLRGRPAVRRVEQLMVAGEPVCVSPINVEEVVRGIRSGEEEPTRQLLGSFVVLSIGWEEAWQAGMWRSRFAAAGVTLSQADCLVAAAAFVAGAKLATGNPAHFPMTEIDVEHWPVGR